MEQLEKAQYGKTPDLGIAANLYCPPVLLEAVPKKEGELGVTRIRVNGTIVRYVENNFWDSGDH